MFGHRAKNVVVGRRVTQAERCELRLAAADDVDRTNAEKLHDPAELIDGERIVEILTNGHFDAGDANQVERSAALATPGVVEEDVGH